MGCLFLFPNKWRPVVSRGRVARPRLACLSNDNKVDKRRYHFGDTLSISERVTADRGQVTTDRQLRRFALAFIHSHSGATGVFAMLLWKFVAEATSCLQKTLQTT